MILGAEKIDEIGRDKKGEAAKYEPGAYAVA
jgi:hypothetical protein